MAAAAPYARVMEDMLKGRDLATQLQGLLRDSPEAGRLVDHILHAISRTCGGKRKAASGAGGGDRRGACRRRVHQSSVVTKTMAMKDMDDGFAWRMYGRKDIQNSKHPKAYFRCTHKYDKHCAAQRQVQRCDDDDDTDTYTVTYIGKHTCQDHADAVAPPASSADDSHNDHHHDDRRTAAGREARAGGAAAAEGRGRGQPSTGRGALRRLTPPGSSAAQRNAAATPGPDQGDVTSGGLQQQHFFDDGVDMATFIYGHDDDTFDLDGLFDIY